MYLKGLILGTPQVAKRGSESFTGVIMTVLKKEKSPTKTRERMYPVKNVSRRESGLYICPRKPFQPTYHCLVGELTPEYLKGLNLGTPQVGKGARNPLLGLYCIKEREESNKERMYPGKKLSGRESGLYIWSRKPFQPSYHCLVWGG